ncbi:MAG: hypothetical protein ACSHXI_14615 [Hoeflea sp.]|uniref:hypothetical protein n=1 Tax=Hoeflea sp. TaxID=1940281 RepID=UPI003EFA6F95
MYRIICRKLLVLIRLAIILSLTGYSLSVAAAAPYSAASADNQLSTFQLMDKADAHLASDDNHRHDSKVDQGSKLLKQQCCDDFCVSFALVTCRNDTSGPVVSTAREFMDEHGIAGETPGFHRPPKV